MGIRWELLSRPAFWVVIVVMVIASWCAWAVLAKVEPPKDENYVDFEHDENGKPIDDEDHG